MPLLAWPGGPAGDKKPFVLEDEGLASAVPPRFAAPIGAVALACPTNIGHSL
jgi:hypothetical protein